MLYLVASAYFGNFRFATVPQNIIYMRMEMHALLPYEGTPNQHNHASVADRQEKGRVAAAAWDAAGRFG